MGIGKIEIAYNGTDNKAELSKVSRPPMDKNLPCQHCNLASTFLIIKSQSALSNFLKCRGRPKYLIGK